MTICSGCVLPDTFPGIRLNADGICHHCSGYDPLREGASLKSKYLIKFQDVMAKAASIGPYDVILAYSGGKDSSYTLKILRKDFNLRLLAVTFNHGFHSPQALENIRAVTRALDVDHMMISPSRGTLRHAFRESLTPGRYPVRALQRASAICNTCMHMVKSLLLKTAIEMQVRLVAYGWSPAQVPIQSSVMRLNGRMVGQMQHGMAAALSPIMGRQLTPYLLTEEHVGKIDESGSGADATGFFYIYPLAFLEYNERQMLQELMELGWRPPKDTDANSTNCLLNAFAVQDQIDRLGFHPYAHMVASLVRQGLMSRETGLARLAQPPDPSVVEYVRKELGLERS